MDFRVSSVNEALIDCFIRQFFENSGHVARLLDVGCGMQPYSKWYHPKAEQSFLLDYQRRGANHIGHFTFGSAMFLPYRDECFDAMVCTEVLEHLPDPQLAAQEMARVLLPGAILVLTVPFNHPLHEVPHDYFRFTPWGLRSLFAANFEFALLLPRGGPLAVLFSAAIAAIDRIRWIGNAALPFLGLSGRPKRLSALLAHFYLALWKLGRNRRVQGALDYLALRDLLEARTPGYMCVLRRRG